MTPAAIVHHVVTTTQAARDYALIQSETDVEVRNAMMRSHAFEIAKRAIGEPRATRFGPIAVEGVRACVCLVVDHCAVFVTVNLLTGEGRIVTDERRRG